MMKSFCSTASAARLCQVSRGSVLRWIHEGRLKAGMTAGGHHRIQTADLLKFLEKLGIPAPGEAEPPEKQIPQKRILIIEYHSDIRRLIKQELHKLWPETVVYFEARDGVHAGWLLNQGVPDLVILPMRKHGGDAHQIHNFLKREKVFMKTKVIAILKNLAKHAPKDLLPGVDGVLRMPFHPAEFEAVFRKQLFPAA